MSTLNVANISDGTDTVETGYVVNGSAKAWVNFNGSGVVAIRDSMNVASLTDKGAGDYAFNFSNAMSNADYSVGTGGVNFHTASLPESVSAAALLKYNASHALEDAPTVCGTTHGDLA